MPKKYCQCGARSVPGLIASVALCQRHYNALMFESGALHDEARRHMHAGPLKRPKAPKK